MVGLGMSSINSMSNSIFPIFSLQKNANLLEVCSGTGDWVVAQAQQDVEANWIASILAGHDS